ncbi:hypothetical protein Baya_12628 [Bagarius yarrelli]|uniref:Uncharacterized protein n=1 Tax=Bagarius yarrelli TaxID=175774 RepID=A0A556V422_BAGYA|nr:hypothetical protein Baya_12628 [Bagarius yarrelli]
MRFTLISAKSATFLKWDFRVCSCSASAQCQRRLVLTAPNTVQSNHPKLQNPTAFNFTGGEEHKVTFGEKYDKDEIKRKSENQVGKTNTEAGGQRRGEASDRCYIKCITNEMGCFELADHTGPKEREKAREFQLHMWQQ